MTKQQILDSLSTVSACYIKYMSTNGWVEYVQVTKQEVRNLITKFPDSEQFSCVIIGNCLRLS